jgi:hypothetical protein
VVISIAMAQNEMKVKINNKFNAFMQLQIRTTSISENVPIPDVTV